MKDAAVELREWAADFFKERGAVVENDRPRARLRIPSCPVCRWEMTRISVCLRCRRPVCADDAGSCPHFTTATFLSV